MTLSLRSIVASGAIPGPRVLTCGVPITTTGGHAHWLGGRADSLDDVILATRARAERGVDFIKIMATGGGMTKGSNMLECQFSPAELAAVVSEAHRLGLRVSAHSQSVLGNRACIAAGVDIVEHCNWLGTTTDEERLGVMAELAEADIAVGVTLSGFFQAHAADADETEGLPDWAAERLADMQSLAAAGVRFAVHSDSIAPVTPHGGFPWSLVAAIRHGSFRARGHHPPRDRRGGRHPRRRRHRLRDAGLRVQIW